MRTVTALRATALGLVALAGTPSSAQKADPILGTWDLNVGKSKYTPGPGRKSESRTYVMEGQVIKVTARRTDAAGKSTSGEWTLNYDGKPHPQTGDPDADSLSVKRIDAFTTEFTQTRAGKAVITGRRTISQDGKVMTITSKGVNANGQAINTVEVFDKR